MMRRFGRLGGNVLIGGLSRVWRLALQFAFTPIYILLLGPEAYGLVSVNATLLLLIAFLDGAVGPVVVREMGRMAGDPDSAPRMHRLLRSLEYLSVATAIGIGAVLALAAPWIAGHWLQTGSMAVEDVTLALRLMALNLALLWPSLLYGAVVLALHRQGDAFRIMAPVTLVQSAGAAAVLWWWAADIHLFLSWLAVFSGLGSLLLSRIAWRALPPAPGTARFDAALMRGVWRFAAGSFFIGITSSLLTQGDKVMMAGVLSLDAFAAYALAFFVAQNAAGVALAPISAAVHPHLAALVAAGDEARLREEYTRWSELTALMGFTLLGTLAAFPAPPLQLWLGAASPLVAPVVALLPWVLLGTLLNALFASPYMLMMAAGSVRMMASYNAVAVAVFMLALWWLAPMYGAMLGPALWVALNLSYFVLLLPRVHRHLLRGHGMAWFWQAVGRPAIVTVVVLAAARMALPGTGSRWWGLAEAVASGLLLSACLLAVLPRARADLIRLFRQAMSMKP